MDANTLDKILELGGQAGVLWVAIIYLTRTLKEAYEKRIDALEQASAKCEADRIKLREKIESFLIDQKNSDS